MGAAYFVLIRRLLRCGDGVVIDVHSEINVITSKQRSQEGYYASATGTAYINERVSRMCGPYLHTVEWLLCSQRLKISFEGIQKEESVLVG